MFMDFSDFYMLQKRNVNTCSVSNILFYISIVNVQSFHTTIWSGQTNISEVRNIPFRFGKSISLSTKELKETNKSRKHNRPVPCVVMGTSYVESASLKFQYFNRYMDKTGWLGITIIIIGQHSNFEWQQNVCECACFIVVATPLSNRSKYTTDTHSEQRVYVQYIYWTRFNAAMVQWK